MPVSISLLPDEVIARGIQGADWGKGFEGFFAGQEQAQKQALQSLFRGGLPRTPQGDIDYRAAAEQIARISGAASIPMLNQLREYELQERGLKGLESTAPQVFGPVTPQQPTPAPTSAVEPDGGVPARPGQANLVQPDETGFKVDYGPVTTSYASGREETQPDTRYPPQFSQAPVTGPPTGNSRRYRKSRRSLRRSYRRAFSEQHRHGWRRRKHLGNSRSSSVLRHLLHRCSPWFRRVHPGSSPRRVRGPMRPLLRAPTMLRRG